MRSVFACFFLSWVTVVVAQQRQPIQAARIATPPTIDGTIDTEAEWKDVPPLDGLWDENTGQVAPMGGTFWLAYDKDFIYFAARMPDSDPKGIRAQEYRTNVSLDNDDSVYLDIDLSGSLASLNSFGVNSRGATDIQLAGGRAAKREWTGEFIAKGRVTEGGWEAEAKIPWQIMQLPGAGAREVRFNLTRNYPRNSRLYRWAYTGSGNFNNFGRWQGVEIPRTNVVRSIKLLPYSYTGYAQDEELIANAGVDLKTTLGEITAVGTINPDFKNIENQILSLDFSRFERLAGETRPFFLEGNQYLGTALFASQRIRKFDAGINVYGKITDKLNFGILEAIDFGERNNFLGNFTYNTDPNNSYRVSYSSLSTPGIKNEGYLYRSNHNVGPWNFFVRHMQTRDRDQGVGISQNVNVNWNQKIWNFFAGYDTASPEFLPRLGFAPDRNYKGVYAGGGINKTYDKGPIQDWGLFLFGDDYDRFKGGGHYHRSVSPSANITLGNGLALNGSASWEDFLGVDDKRYNVSASYPRNSNKWNIGFDYGWGELALERFTSRSISAFYRPMSKLTFTASIQDFRHIEKSDQAIFGWNYDLGKDTYLSGRAVKSNSDWNGYLSFRKSGNRGAEYILILGDPNAQKWRSSLILKVVFPLEFKY